MGKSLVLVLLVLLCCLPSYGFSSPDTVSNSEHIYIGGFYQAGKVLPTNNFIKGENRAGKPISFSQTFSLEIGNQTTGDKDWQQIYNFPRYGAGISVVDFSYARETGTPVTLYGYFSGPFKRWGKTSINFMIGMGLTSNWRPYGINNNPWNTAIGSLITAYVDLGTDLTFFISERLDLDVGFHFIHYSNGAVTMPNAGINQYALRLAMRHDFSGHRPVFIRRGKGKSLKTWELASQAGCGPKQMSIDTLRGGVTDFSHKIKFNVFDFRSELMRQISHKVKLGGGLDLTYDEANRILVRRENGKAVKRSVPINQNLLLSAYGSVELVIDRLNISVQPGVYLVRTKTTDSSPLVYEQLGVKYHLLRSGNLYVGLSLRAYQFHIADFIQWNLGYRIRWN